MRRILNDPLFHFAVAGAVLFAAFGLFAPDAPSRQAPVGQIDTAIVIDAAVVERLDSQFAAVWNRPPTEQELAGLIDGYITEEILVRQALALGLDAGDAVVRQRLRQKMEFLLEAGAGAEDPTDAELQAFLEENAETFRVPPRIGFSQAFLGEAPSAAEVNAARDALRGGAEPADVGRGSLLPARVPPSPPQAIDGTFGRGVFSSLADLPLGQWAGPIGSGYGQHLVRVDERRPARVPPLAEIRNDVALAWRDAAGARAREARLAELRDIYTVERDEELTEAVN